MERKRLKDKMMLAIYKDYSDIIYALPNIKAAKGRSDEIAGYLKILDTIGVLELSDETMLFLSKLEHPLLKISSYTMNGSDLETVIRDIKTDWLCEKLHDNYDYEIFHTPDIQTAVDRASEFVCYQKILKAIEETGLSDERLDYLIDLEEPLTEISKYMKNGEDLEAALKTMMEVHLMGQEVIQT